MKQSVYSFKQLLSGGLLCCAILLAAYLFQVFFPEMFVDSFSSSLYLLMWLSLFVGALVWTFREKEERGVLSKIIDWQFIAAFLLITADQIYIIMPKEVHVELGPVLSAYTLPTLIIIGILMAGIIRFSISLKRKLENEHQQSILQTHRLQQLLDSPPARQAGIPLVRQLIENQSIAQLSASEYAVLIEGCQIIDPDFFAWMKAHDIHLPPRHLVLCVLIRMHKTKEEILSIFSISEGNYRTMKSRIRDGLGIEDKDMEKFLQTL